MPTAPGSSISLFCAFSTLSQYGDYRNVDVSWTVRYRRQPVADYRTALSARRLSHRAQHSIDELFLETEVTELQNLLMRRNIPVETYKIDLPCEGHGFALGDGPIPDYWEEINLWKELDYDLPFPVVGYFEPVETRGARICPPIVRKDVRSRYPAICSLCGCRFVIKPPQAYFLRDGLRPVHSGCADQRCVTEVPVEGFVPGSSYDCFGTPLVPVDLGAYPEEVTLDLAHIPLVLPFDSEVA